VSGPAAYISRIRSELLDEFDHDVEARVGRGGSPPMATCRSQGAGSEGTFVQHIGRAGRHISDGALELHAGIGGPDRPMFSVDLTVRNSSQERPRKRRPNRWPARCRDLGLADCCTTQSRRQQPGSPGSRLDLIVGHVNRGGAGRSCNFFDAQIASAHAHTAWSRVRQRARRTGNLRVPHDRASDREALAWRPTDNCRGLRWRSSWLTRMSAASAHPSWRLSAREFPHLKTNASV